MTPLEYAPCAHGPRPWLLLLGPAGVLAVKGEIQPALDWLEKAMEWGFAHADHAMADTDLDVLRSDPRLGRRASGMRISVQGMEGMEGMEGVEGIEGMEGVEGVEGVHGWCRAEGG